MGAEPDSEAALYRRMLLQRSYAYRRHARVLLTSGISIFVATSIVLVGFWLTRSRLQHAPYLFINLGVVACLAVASLVMIAVGGYLWRKTGRAIDAQEENRFRQRERSRLFRQAQGRLPWGYRRVSRVILLLASLLLMIVGGIILHFFGLGALDGWGYMFFGVMVAFVTIFALPRAGRRVRQESAEQLASYLMIGEARVRDTSDAPTTEEDN